jgi:lysozyme family protein
MRQETAGARVRCVIRPQISQEHPIPNSSLSTLIAANARRWALARQLTTKSVAFQAAARRLVAARVRYQNVTQATGVPWHVIAVIHEREASQRWDASIAQGDPWARVSTHVPKGRGPFASWDAAAIDALRNCAPFAAQRRDWSVGGTLTLLEQYNGLGYAHRNQPSPYIWAGTDQYARGKYVADGHYDPAVVDTQLGCAGLLLAMADIDAAVAEALGKTALIVAKPSPSTLPPLPPLPSVVTPQPSSVKPLPPQSWLWRAALRLVTTFFKTS